ncbi:response regulator [Paenibacillus sp. OAS669]|uniref:response regulator n=1 Tax=Paenibacillus sp. OAS669 TaxID=2663821 RepID=UPI0017897D30|nr:response regulator [Paenibacillus sp. OAS669]MBE1445878.1 two-component system response regulator YesN [Paenibacillus sp. OAS669]
MIRLLLVDDEPVILEDLTLFIRKTTNFDCVYTAASGQEAVQIIEQFPVDIVVTDIRMPGMTGLEFCKYIKQKKMDIECILLSGYAEFEYAQQALKTNAAAYLLKPVKKDELLQTILQTAEVLQQKRAAVVSNKKAQETLRSHIVRLQASLLLDLLKGGKQTPEILTEEMERLSIPFSPGDKTALMLLRIENRFLEYEERDISLFEYAIVNIAEEVLREFFEVWSCKDDSQYLAFLVKTKNDDLPDASRKKLEQLIPQLQHYITIYLQGKISVIISDFEDAFPQGITELYQKALMLFRRLPESEQELFHRLWDQPPHTPLRPLQRLHEPPTVLQLIETGRWQDAQKRLDYIFEELSSNGMDSAEYLSEVYFALSNAYTYVIHMYGLQMADVIEEPYMRGNNTSVFRTVRLLHAWAAQMLNRLKERVAVGGNVSKSSLVLQIHQYIERHLSENVTLQAISEHVHLHPSYLSAAYKQETGENLSEYIYRYRMEKAAYLLRNSKAKIYEISAMIGYQYTPYFTKLFKSYYNVSPQEYRGMSGRE